MVLEYLVNNTKKTTSFSNEDITFISEDVIKANKEIKLVTAVKSFDFMIDKKDLYFLNGYQSWSRARFDHPTMKEGLGMRRNVIPGVNPYGDYDFYKRKNDRLHSWDIFYSVGNNELFIINNNYRHTFLIIEILKKENRINLIADVNGKLLKEGEEFKLYNYDLYHSYQEGLEAFKRKFPRRNLPKLFGYTSWYNYFQNINEEIILRDLSSIDKRFDLFQIDDGYETFVGDWLDIDKKKFPHGLKPIVDKIHEKGLKAGIWLAPFVAEQDSKIFKEHPDWFVKDKNGEPLKTGISWSGQYALDTTKPEVMSYIEKCLRYYADMGFDFFKLDFLYSASYTHPNITKAESSSSHYRWLKEVLKGKTILGCGAVLFNVIDNFDYVRIGCDVTIDFVDPVYSKLPLAEVPSTKMSIQNTINRFVFNDRLFGNDPDVFLLRDDNITLTKDQKRTLAIINAICGQILLTSDDIGKYDEEKNKLLNRVIEIFRNEKEIIYYKKRNLIHIKCLLDKKEYDFAYDINKGIIVKK